jgi:hypothetical protein
MPTSYEKVNLKMFNPNPSGYKKERSRAAQGHK